MIRRETEVNDQNAKYSEAAPWATCCTTMNYNTEVSVGCEERKVKKKKDKIPTLTKFIL